MVQLLVQLEEANHVAVATQKEVQEEKEKEDQDQGVENQENYEEEEVLPSVVHSVDPSPWY